jgi:NAD(P)-dependent dehydrogenase (short-subunit alcohol dehydrogenase family)
MKGLIHMSRTFLPILLTSYNHDSTSLCTIINLSSSGALTARPGNSAYRSSKLAILRFTETLNLEYSDKGLLAFCVNPGAIKTELSRNETEKVRERLPHSAELAGDTIAFLASERREWLGGRYVSCPLDVGELLETEGRVCGEGSVEGGDKVFRTTLPGLHLLTIFLSLAIRFLQSGEEHFLIEMWSTLIISPKIVL